MISMRSFPIFFFLLFLCFSIFAQVEVTNYNPPVEQQNQQVLGQLVKIQIQLNEVQKNTDLNQIRDLIVLNDHLLTSRNDDLLIKQISAMVFGIIFFYSVHFYFKSKGLI